MELTNEFTLAVPVAEAWGVLTNIEMVAPCMPGADLREVEDDEYRGLVKVKVGPITASYRGAAKFLELDQTAGRAVLKAEGRETRGQGNATAIITAILISEGDGTRVEVSTDLAVTGKVAQFGRGVLAEVSAKLLDQFVQNLETAVLEPTAASAGHGRGRRDPDEEMPVCDAEMPAARKDVVPRTPANGGTEPDGVGVPPVAAAPTPSVPSLVESAPTKPLDFTDITSSPLMRRLLPFTIVVGVMVLGRVVIYLLRRR